MSTRYFNTDIPWVIPTGNTPIENIAVGDRRREDSGDIDSLAESIRTYGLLHPVVLTRKDTPDLLYDLVAGFRRLEACKRLGWRRIPYTLLGELTPRQLREIELEENLRRKDFTEYERSKDMATLAEAVAERLQEEAELLAKPAVNPEEIDESKFRSTLEQNPKGGRPSEPGSVRAVAREIGVSPASIINARAHVAAVDQYPALKDAPKMVAIETAREAAKLPEPERASFVEKANKEYDRWAKDFDQKTKTVYKRLREATSYDFCVDATATDIDEWLATFCSGRDEVAECVDHLTQSIERLTHIKDHLTARKNRLSLVKGGITS